MRPPGGPGERGGAGGPGGGNGNGLFRATRVAPDHPGLAALTTVNEAADTPEE